MPPNNTQNSPIQNQSTSGQLPTSPGTQSVPPAKTDTLVPGTDSKNGPPRPKFSGKSKEASERQKKQVATAQNSLLIAEIRDGLVIMRDGSLRAVVMCQSINFDLMSEQEKEAVEQSYQAFLNSLSFPIQIYIRSRRVDLNKYIDKLSNINKEQENILLSLLMEDYISYVQYLTQSSNIMNKQFYIVVPYYPTIQTKQGFATGLRKLTNVLKPAKQTLTIGETDFNQYKDELSQHVQVVLNGLQQLNVQSVPLNTEELIELYYTVYNPETAVNEKLADSEDLQSPVVSKGTGQAAAEGDSNGIV